MRALIYVPYTFVLMNCAAVKALYCFVRGDDPDQVWSGHRAAERGSGVLRTVRP
jgi:hypothetical protein